MPVFITDTLIENANGIQVDEQGKLDHFTGLVVGSDGRVVQLVRPGADKAPAKLAGLTFYGDARAGRGDRHQS